MNPAPPWPEGVRRPDAFLVGAPKSGTTSLYEWLRVHPELFVPAKELHYFGHDFTFRRPRLSAELYHEAFRPAGREKRVVDVAVWYLLSRSAAGEIHAVSPDARILALLRHPVDMLHSLHAELVRNGREDIEDFPGALEAEAERRRGLRLPAAVWFDEMLHYRAVADYAEQLRRYVDTFGRERVHVVLFDDLTARPEAVYAETLQFLGVDPTFRPDFRVANVRSTVRSTAARRLLDDPPSWLQRAGRHLMSPGRRLALRQRLWKVNARPAPTAALDPAVRRQLLRELTPEILRLADLLERDLSAWLEHRG